MAPTRPAGEHYAPYSALTITGPDDDAVLDICIDTPGKLNAVDGPKHSALADVWKAVDTDPDTRVVVIHGAGGTFSAGGDMAMVERMMDDFEMRADAFREARDIVYNMINCSKIIVSAIEGVAVGAGLAAAFMADISVAGRSARILDGHTKLGVAAGDHAAIIWPLLCGMAKSKYYLLTCDSMNGEEAEAMGLVSKVVDDDKVIDTAYEIARRLAAGSQSAIRWTKYSLNNWLRTAGPAFDTSAALEMLGFTGPDVREGHAAIVEKRRPRFA
ncbi:MAG TPA: enoyl-CoA hydratase [Acidimicrobiaceae bacterium]|nr:enoyl-CoA hydratase [Acidimicrobiaceae bacterium]HCB37002.1 enoyl-CoA hydratase [Acidimicrobiaceae bacterium]